jgi:hypothetical protein
VGLNVLRREAAKLDARMASISFSHSGRGDVLHKYNYVAEVYVFVRHFALKSTQPNSKLRITQGAGSRALSANET